jgi:hypothetical protein
MLGGLFDDIRSTVSSVRYGQSVRTLTVAKPYCFPARSIITGALQPYGVKIHNIREQVIKVSLLDFARRMKIELKTFENLKFGPAAPIFLPMAVHAQVTVNEAAAAWAEYLLLRTGKLYVPGRYVDPRNQQWAEKHGGRMPPAWNEGKPWIEANCKDGVQAWQQVKDAVNDRQTANSKQ